MEYTDKLTDRMRKSISDLEFYNCGIEQCARGQFYGPKRRDYHFIHFVIRGGGNVEIDGQVYPVKANQLFLVPADTVSTYRASVSDPWKYCWIGFLGIRSFQLVATLMRCSTERFVQTCQNAAAYEHQIASILNLSGKGISTHLRCNGLMYDLIGRLLEDLNADDPESMDFSVPSQACQYMELHYHDNLKIAEVAAAVGVHANYLANVFQEQYHMTPKQYLTKLKLAKAKELLLRTGHPVYIVANSVGFSDPLAFSNFFRRLTGMSPTEYRNRQEAEQ